VASRWARDWSARDERMLMSIGQQVAQAIINSQQFAQAQSKAQDWESNYHTLQQANNELARRAEALERQIQELQRIEQQIWTALAASQAARRRFERGLTVADTLDGGQQPSGPLWRKTASSSIDKQLAATLRKVLASMKKEK
jgi:chromosome segregation ATPase